MERGEAFLDSDSLTAESAWGAAFKTVALPYLVRCVVMGNLLIFS